MRKKLLTIVGMFFAGMIICKDKKMKSLQIGDNVQWESGGACQFKSPRKVTAISECGEWAFVEGSTTGLPTSQLKVQDETNEKI